MKKAVLYFLMVFVVSTADAAEIKTTNTTVRYSAAQDVDDVLYRLTGKKEGAFLTVLDEIIEDVQHALDTYGLVEISVVIKPGNPEGLRGEYNAARKEILIYTKDVTRGIFAHEAAHAILCQTFKPTPSHAIQEMVAQAVDKEIF